MTNETQSADKRQKKLTGWHVLAMLLALFGVVFAVNGYMIFKALQTFSGEKSHAYLEGLHFNETLNARAKQAALGWEMGLNFKRGAAGDAIFTATLKDKAGLPITGAKISGTIGRATQSGDDKELQFVEKANGEYAAPLASLEPGKWLFSATAVVSGKPDFSAETELSIR